MHHRTGPFPSNFESVEKTLRERRKLKFGKPPSTPEAIVLEFEKADVLGDLGSEISLYLSLQRDKGPFYNTTLIGNNHSSCIFLSAKSIALVKEHLEVHERFF